MPLVYRKSIFPTKVIHIAPFCYVSSLKPSMDFRETRLRNRSANIAEFRQQKTTHFWVVFCAKTRSFGERRRNRRHCRLVEEDGQP